MGRKKDINKKVDAFYTLFEEIKQLATEKRTEMTNIDREWSSVYHKLEGIEITHISQSHKLVKEMKDVLERRRKVKVEDSMLRSIVDQLGGQMGNAQKKTKEILKKHAEVVEEIRVRAIE